ncbi:hypothetical protein LTR37_001130 [Vermiconidia calcicola]|uniref:Uncharacterized protein n=1 Tax=Vermiconidia calcicola TaxID=1690605 RepID=A0ACC3NX67_9PEZI|nr:hypothetical protein LTR37_001130 [Vermiconidia calcicola]
MDPYKATREQFTEGLLNTPIPDNATNEWKKLVTHLKHLQRLLAYHSAMKDTGNLAQVYMVPAISKNKVYFMWDFVDRTLGILYGIPPTKPFSVGNELWRDVYMRTILAANLLLDKRAGQLDEMVDMTYPGHSYRPEIGEGILAAARTLQA